MTKQEQLEARLQRAQEKRAKDRAALASVKSALREQARKTRDQRRYHVGRLADEAGLLVWEDSTLADLFTLLATLQAVPTPVAVLEGLLREGDGHALAEAEADTIPGRNGVSAAH